MNPCFKNATVNSFPYSSGLLKKSKLPLALILQPYLSDEKVREKEREREDRVHQVFPAKSLYAYMYKIRLKYLL